MHVLETIYMFFEPLRGAVRVPQGGVPDSGVNRARTLVLPLINYM